MALLLRLTGIALLVYGGWILHPGVAFMACGIALCALTREGNKRA